MEEKKMKNIKLLSIFAFCAAVVISCNKEIAETLPPEGNTSEQTLLNPVTLTFEASPSTKVSIDETGKASWENGDRIKIISLDATGKPKAVVSDEVVIDAAGVGRFTATVEASDLYYAVYPSTLEVSLTQAEGAEPIFAVEFSSTPTAKTKISDAAYYAAKTTAETKYLDFRTISTILEVKTGMSDATGILFSSYGEGISSCSGIIPVNFDSEGKVSLSEPEASSSTLTFGIAGAGTYYLPLPGNGKIASDANGDGFVLCLCKNDGKYTASYYPKALELKAGKIYNFKDNVESKIVSDYYLSVDGTGTGLAADSPLAFANLKNLPAFKSNTAASAMMRNGVTVHLAGGTYTTALWTYATTDGADKCKLTISGSADEAAPTVFKTKASSKFADSNLTTRIENVNFSGCTAVALIASCGSLELENCKFTSNVTTENGSAITVNTNAFVSAKSCEFSGNEAKNGAGLCITPPKPVVPRQDDEVIFTCEDCLFSKNEVTGSGAAVLIAQAATGGQVRFNNCRFEGNEVNGTESHAAAFFCNNSKPEAPAPMAFFNACSFWKNNKTATSSNTTSFGYEIYGNTGSRIAMNNCTFNTPNCRAARNGCDITCIGQTVIANSTIWGTTFTGRRALVFVGSKESASPSLIVNCMIHHKNTTETLYNTLFLTGNYYLNMFHSIFAGLLGSTSPAAVDGTNYKFTNCYDRKLKQNDAPVGATYLTNDNENDCTIRGIKHEIYKYDFAEGEAATYPGFELATKAAVIAAVESNAVGVAFSSWLKELGAYDKDMLGKQRTKIYPGSYHNTQGN